MGSMAATTQTPPKPSEAKLLVVEDDANIVELLAASLRTRVSRSPPSRMDARR